VISLYATEFDPSPFSRDNFFEVDKTAPDGTKYTVNNSTASFSLDVKASDKHCKKIFRDYSAVLEYCRSESLNIIPSTHLIQGKLKQFDDGLCAALETAIQHGLPGDGRLGKQAALSKLLDELIAIHREMPSDKQLPVESAIVDVATALRFGGVEPELDKPLTAQVDLMKDSFLQRPMQSRPIGFWTWSEDLQNIFRQDRYLYQGISAEDDLPSCMVLAATISRTPELSEAFTRFRNFDASLTNPQMSTLSFDKLAELLPHGKTIAEMLDSEIVEKTRAAIEKHYGKDRTLALISYSESKEYDTLEELFGSGLIEPGPEGTMQAIIDAIKSGRLSLEPKPDSGWYDYQWYALETLLLSDKARESVKLTLSDAYKARLENCFKTSLTKHRETHIKHVPQILMGCMSEPDTPPPEVRIGPEFSAEPTATVYLRYARAYRFLSNAMPGILGDDFLSSIHRSKEGLPSVEETLDSELRRMTLLC